MVAKKLIKNIRRFAWRVLGTPDVQNSGYAGKHGCIKCAASFLAWNQVEGDYLEFGVYRGGSFAAAYHSIWGQRKIVKHVVRGAAIEQWYQKRPRFIAFDSFKGAPAGAFERDADYGEGAYSCSESEFLENIEADDVDLNDVVTVPGFYDETLTAESKERLGLKQAALVMIDCGLYESAAPALNFITNLVGQGTIIVFFEWYRFKGRPDSGEQRACREWLQKNPHLKLVKYWQEGPQAVSFMVNVD